MKDSVRAICQADPHVWVALDNGKLLMINKSSYKTDYQISRTKLDKDNLVEMITVDDSASLIALAYKDGQVVFVKSCLKSNGHQDVGVMHSLALGILDEVNLKHEKIKLFTTNISPSHQLYAVEACKPQDTEQVELWCACEKSVIEIFVPFARSSLVQLKAVLNTNESSTDISQDANIIQLKSSNNTNMYALHSNGRIISCWSVGEQPKLITVIKPHQLSSPGNVNPLNACITCNFFIVVNTIFPLGDAMIIGDSSGKVYEMNLSRAIHNKDFSCKQLPSHHQPDTKIRFLTLLGKMSPQGILSSIGESVPEEPAVYVNIFNVGSPDDLPCVVLLGLRAGYGSALHPEQTVSSSLYFTTWAFTDTS